MSTEEFSGDGGFTLLEVLIALVLSSLLLIAVSGLFVFAGQLGEQAVTSNAVERALLDLRAAGAVLNIWSTGVDAVTVADLSESGFVERRSSNGGVLSEVRISLNRSPRKNGITLDLQSSSTSQPSPVDLSTFDGAQIEYLELNAQGDLWVDPSRLGSTRPRAVRLNLHKAQRRWFIVLWMDNDR